MPSPFSPESSAKARETSDFQRSIYKRDFGDEEMWRQLASEAGYKLPYYFTRPSDSGIKSALRTLGLSWVDFAEAFGWANAADFESMNPKWGMMPLAGLILEIWDEKRRLVENCQSAAVGRGALLGKTKPKRAPMPRGLAKAKRVALPALEAYKDAI